MKPTVEQLQRTAIGEYPFTPLTYPGRRPRFSFLFTPGGIYRFKPRALESVLASRGLTPSSERYAILAYGSNACPGQLLDKHLSDVPVIFGRLDGAQAVFACRTASRGYVPATVARVEGRHSSWITLLTKEQLKIMDESEGRQGNYYVLAGLPKVRFSVGSIRFTPLYTYVEMRGGVMTIDGQPVKLRSNGQKRAKSLLPNATAGPATDWLDLEIIPHPNSPAQYSQIVRHHGRVTGEDGIELGLETAGTPDVTISVRLVPLQQRGHKSPKLRSD